MSKVDWKQKYLELRSKYINSIDVAFRHGFEEGYNKSKVEMMEMQLQQAQEAAAMAAQAAPAMGEEMPAEEGGDPLVQSIDELEQYVKHEKPDFESLLKSAYKSESKNTENKSLEEKQKIINKLFDS